MAICTAIIRRLTFTGGNEKCFAFILYNRFYFIIRYSGATKIHFFLRDGNDVSYMVIRKIIKIILSLYLYD